MAFAYEIYPYVGRDYNVPFPYLDPKHVKVKVDGNPITDWEWVNASTLRLGATVTGSFVTVYRKSSPAERMVDYEVPGPLTEEDLDTDSLQSLYLSQEALDIEERVLNTAFDDQWDARGRRIKNLANSINPQDAVTRSELDSAVVAAGNIRKPLIEEVGMFIKAVAVDTWEWAQLTFADIAGTIADIPGTLNDVAGVLSVEKGGTGASDPETARANLGIVDKVQLENFSIILSGETSAPQVGTDKFTFHMPYDFQVIDVKGSLRVAQDSGQNILVDVNVDGESIFGLGMPFLNGQVTPFPGYQVTNGLIPAGSKVSVDIDQVGDGTARGLKIYLLGTQV